MVLIVIFSTFIGSIAGIGGGIIMKPAFSLFTDYDPIMINYIVAYIIFIMTTYNCLSNYHNLKTNVKLKHISLIIGVLLGSYFGNLILVNFVYNTEVVQALLLSITIFLVLFSTNREFNVVVKQTKTNFFIMGVFSSLISSFMGIGGGVFNVLIFNKLFKYSTKTSVSLSLLTILFTQVMSIITLSITTSYEIGVNYILLYGTCAIIGAIFGSKIHKKLNDYQIKQVYKNTLTIFIFINILLIFI